MSEYTIEIREPFDPRYGSYGSVVDEFADYARHSILSTNEMWILRDSDGNELARYEGGKLHVEGGSHD